MFSKSTLGPVDKVFEQFRYRFDAIPVDDQDFNLWTWPQPNSFLHTCATTALTFCEQHLLTGDIGREDYRKVDELIIKYLGGQVCLHRYSKIK